MWRRLVAGRMFHSITQEHCSLTLCLLRVPRTTGLVASYATKRHPTMSSTDDDAKFRTTANGGRYRIPDECEKCHSTENLRECSKCHHAAYCSRECQVADWSTHKNLCKMWVKMSEATNRFDWLKASMKMANKSVPGGMTSLTFTHAGAVSSNDTVSTPHTELVPSGACICLYISIYHIPSPPISLSFYEGNAAGSAGKLPLYQRSM